MKLPIRRLALGLVALAAAFCVHAQPAYPAHALRAVIPWPPGQATDLVGRVVAQKLSETLGQPVIPDNRAGAGGTIGTDYVAKAQPDGYTLLIASSGPVSVNPLLQKVPYDVERDFIPVARIGISNYLRVTSASFPAANAAEFVALVKANPGRYTFGSSGSGATAHIIAEWLNMRAGLKVTHVPYKGSAAALADVASGQVTYAMETIAATMPLVRGGRLRAYGISTRNPSELAPGLAPLADTLGLPGFDVGAWVGVMVTAGTPRDVVDRLSAVLRDAMRSSEIQDKLNAVGIDPAYLGPDDFARDLRDQRDRFGEIIRSAGIRLE